MITSYFDMVNLTNFERKTIITSGINKEYIRKYNNPKHVKNFNTMLFTKTFEKYLKKDELELKQCQSLLEICPNSLNTVLVVLLLGQVIVAYLQAGEEKLMAPIDVETGLVTSNFYDKKKNSYKKHPNSQKEVQGFSIPNWDKVIALAEQAALEVPAIGYVSFEIAIEENKCYLIDGSLKPNHNYYKLVPHKNNNIGLLPLFKKKEKRKVKE